MIPSTYPYTHRSVYLSDFSEKLLVLDANDHRLATANMKRIRSWDGQPTMECTYNIPFHNLKKPS